LQTEGDAFRHERGVRSQLLGRHVPIWVTQSRRRVRPAASPQALFGVRISPPRVLRSIRIFPYSRVSAIYECGSSIETTVHELTPFQRSR